MAPDEVVRTRPTSLDVMRESLSSLQTAAASIRLQAEEHPVIDDGPAATPEAHCARLMHLKAYDEALPYAAGKDILDVGCNTGYGTLAYLNVARRVVGVDVSPAAIEVARAYPGAAEFSVIDGITLPFADDTFDVVTSFQVLEHILDPAPYLREIARVLRPGGVVIFTTPNAATRLDPGMTPWNRFHVREYLADELQELLRGFFPQVRVRGMFGTPTLYETEIARVDKARVRIRAREGALQARAEREAARAAALAAAEAARAEREAARQAHLAAPPRRGSLPARIAKKVLPAVVVAKVRSMRGHPRPAAIAPQPTPVPTAVPPPEGTSAPDPTQADAVAHDMETFLRYTVDDLFYADRDLDRAMDFMAICSMDDA